MKTILPFIFCLFTIVISAQEMPKMSLKNLEGETISTAELAKSDEVKVFSFWATWCVPCINELDAISEVYEDWQDETNVEIIAVATDDTRTKKRIRPMVNGKSWEYTILLDDNQDLKRALNISTIPHVVVVKNGKIVYRHTGYTPGAEEELYEVIKKHSK